MGRQVDPLDQQPDDARLLGGEQLVRQPPPLAQAHYGI
jgi:hypothetical protein